MPPSPHVSVVMLPMMTRKSSGGTTSSRHSPKLARLAASTRAPGAVRAASARAQKRVEAQRAPRDERLDFEAAARVRDQLQGLDQLTADQKMSLPDSSVSRDVVALASDERLAAVQLFQMRAGKLVGRLGYMADADGLDPGLILQRVIEEHYSQVDAVEIPPELLVQHPLPQQQLLEEWLTEQRERRVQIHCPKQRQKADLIERLEKSDIAMQT